ncbi:sensor histidine kinase [Sphaerimonospora cavernae]|uniref:histidine kinase n=1 Tax=Sphaerimonospora cavernae TaxID=1740611 RepID=A0ABV6U0E9_9ACTN
MIDEWRTRPLYQQVLAALAAAGVATLLVLEGLDTRFLPTTVGVVACGALCVVALVVPPARFSRYTAMAVAASCALSLVQFQLSVRPEHTPGMTELGVLLLLITRAVRRCSPLRAVAMTAGLSLAALLVPVRIPEDQSNAISLAMVAILCCLPLMVMSGLVLRLRDRLRARELDAALQAQRLEYARDLHDFVAHHVTGIVMQAKAVRFATEAGLPQGPEELDRMLAGIEDAGGKALDAMRSMVRTLRDQTPAPLGPVPGLPELLMEVSEDFAGAGPLIEVTVDPRLTGRYLEPRIVEVIGGVAREALTNVRKHAVAATRVTVSAGLGNDDWLEVSVTDDGENAGSPGSSASSDGGFGLTGLAERVEEVGGQITAGWDNGSGWRVVARLPVKHRSDQ